MRPEVIQTKIMEDQNKKLTRIAKGSNDWSGKRSGAKTEGSSYEISAVYKYVIGRVPE